MKEFKFDSAHYLNGYRGACQNLHGHTWKVAVMLGGTELNELGMLIDFKKIKAIVDSLIIARFDHKLLNDVIPFNPTAENLAKFIYDELSTNLFESENGRVHVQLVKIWENYPESCAIYQP
jgi:6-pyruvoyltetrahydropterin/6-carboxytetrahydropterin synthase